MKQTSSRKTRSSSNPDAGSPPGPLRAAARLLPHALLADRFAARREIEQLQRLSAEKAAPAEKRCRRLLQRLEDSAAQRRRRLGPLHHLRLDPQLPISAKKQELIAAIREHQVLVVAGETGSGKSTQLPKLCLLAGRGVDGAVGVTQPRRIAALTVGWRIAEEMGEPLGATVGVKIRFQEKSSTATRIKLMTDGILLAEAHGDRSLLHYDTIIVDEAHERSLNIDFILGLLKQLLRRRRDLKVIITSATIDTEKFSQAFGGAPIIEVSGRTYPVQTVYLAPCSGSGNGEENTPGEQAVQALDQLFASRPAGDILIFMPTEQDIRDTLELIQGRRFARAQAVPLFARLSAEDQQRVFQPAEGIKIVVATNVAETSITIPGIRYVIDTGLARISQYAPRTRTNTLPVLPISQSSADQRKGRCGRVAPGICYRLYSEEDYAQRPKYTLPEILRANLAEVILRMLALRLGEVQDFPFIDPPAPRSIQDGLNLLLELGAIRSSGGSGRAGQGRYVLTAKGRLMARLPLDPRLSCILLEARERGCLTEVAVLAAALSIQDPRERPADKQAEADAAHAAFADPCSDFITLLRIWQAYDQSVAGRVNWQQVKQFCRASFLSFRRMREWRDVFHQIVDEMAEHDIRCERALPQPLPAGDPGDRRYAAVHQAVLSGFLSNIAVKKERQIFQASHNRLAMIFPGSGLFKNPGQWIVAAEMVETSRLFARTAAVIDPAWLEPIAGEQCRYAWSDPHWERRREAVMATEQISLYGLIIERRLRPYGPVQAQEASQIFIRKALIEEDVRTPLPFMQHNRKLIEELRALEERLRRRDLLADEIALLQFYQERLGPVFDMQGLKAKIRQMGADDFLRLRKEDLLLQAPDPAELAQYPTRIAAAGRQLGADYRFAPGEEEDGITVRVPQETAADLPDQSFQWLVPGLLKEKIIALIKALPKELRKQLVPINETAQAIAEGMPEQRELPLAVALSRFLRQHSGVEIPPSAWSEQQLPDYLRMRIALTDRGGRIVRVARDPAVLQQAAPSVDPQDFRRAAAAWERGPVTQWDFGDLSEAVELQLPGGRRISAYPALAKRGAAVVLSLFADAAAARRAHRQGVKALLMRSLSSDIKFLRRNLSLPLACEAACRYFGGRSLMEEQLLESVLETHLAHDIRTAAGYDALLEELHTRGIAAWGQQRRAGVIAVLEAYQAARMQLAALVEAHPGNASLRTFIEGLRSDLQRLVPERFVTLYEEPGLEQLPRYIRALGLRAARAAVDLEKDRAKAQRIAPYQGRLQRLVASMTAQTSQAKRQAIEDFFWLLEEYKISVFAPEIKTAGPVSGKRLDKAVSEIEGMI